MSFYCQYWKGSIHLLVITWKSLELNCHQKIKEHRMIPRLYEHLQEKDVALLSSSLTIYLTHAINVTKEKTSPSRGGDEEID